VNELENTITFNEERLDLREFILKESNIKKYIVDASVALKWYYGRDEEDLEKAEELYGFFWSDREMLMAPELIVYEILNTLRLKTDIALEDIGLIISNIFQVVFLLDTEKEFLEKAFKYSRELDISYYDGIYITFSEKYDSPLITADKKLYEACKETRFKTLLISDI
jgi:predicted nucleic acid-binding protein